MALLRKDRAKSAKERRSGQENSQSYSSNAGKSFIVGTYLESLNDADIKINSKKRSPNKSGKVAKRSLREMGAYSWIPLATRTAVGYGDNLYMETLSPEKGLIRPESAPNFRMRRSRSMNSVDTMSSGSFTASLVTSHASSRKKSKKDYMEEPITLCVRAFPNGTIGRSVRVVAKTLAQLLEEATGKLDLPSAGRRIFLPDGTLVVFAHQLYKDCSVYISMGEPFKDPCEVLRDNERMRLSSSWTITGIMLPEDRTNSKKTKLSKRMKSLLENPKHRVLVFRNGESREGAEVVANRFDEFLNDCTGKLSLTASARILYIWNGSEAQNFLELSKANTGHLIQTSQHGSVLGPVWVSKGEPFDPTGAYEYFMGIAMNLKQEIKQEVKNLKNLQKMLDGGEENCTKEQMSHDDIEKELAKGKASLSSMKVTLKELKSRLKVIKTSSEIEIPPEIISNKRFDNTKGYRLKLRLNGSENPNSIVLPFSSKDFRRGKKTKEEMLRGFFDLLNSSHSLRECFIGRGRRAEFKRAFLLNGTEITDINDLHSDAEVWLSLGEDFIPIEYEVLGIATDTVKCISYWSEKTICQRQPWLGAEGKLAKPSLWDMITSVPVEIMANELIPELTKEDEKLVLVNTMNKERLRTDGVFLQNKKEANLVLYPELALARIGMGHDVTFWGENAKQWILSQDGTITNKLFTNMALSIGDEEISVHQSDQAIKGYAVGLALRNSTLASSNENTSDEQGTRPQVDPRQQWKLTPDGHIASVMLTDLYLTSICGLRVEIPQDTKGKEDDHNASKSSLSSSSDSESSLEPGGDEAKTKKMKKRKKKDKKAKEKKKWWDFGSSSSSDSSEEDDVSKEMKKSSEDIKVRMKSTSSEDDKNEVYSERERTSIVEEELDIGEKSKEDVVRMANDLLKEMPDVYGGEKILFGVFDKSGDKHPMEIRQRWAIKTEDAGSLLSSATLSNKWIRQELAWPVNEANVWVEDSITGFIVPCAPKLKRKVPKKETPNSSFYGQPARLKVLRNGEHESSRAVTVIGPDLSNMTRRVQASLPLKWKKSKGGFQDVQGASVADVEFEKFLDKCTESLGLPFAARRLFDEKGKELTAVNTLERDQLVYVSCGENWVDPNVTYSEQQRRLLLASLASDVCKIRNYTLLRDQSDLIIQVDGALQANSRLILTKKPDNEEVHSNEVTDSSTVEDQTMQENAIRQLQKSYLNSHQIAHIKSDERLQNIREQFQHDLGVASNMGTIDNTEDYSPFSNPSIERKFSPSEEPVSKSPPSAFHQWVYHDGFIQLKANKKLVIGVQDSDESTAGQDVVICNKKVEDSLQRWVISDLGFIHLKCNPQLVLTVGTPVLQTDPFSDTLQSNGYAESRIILGRRLDYCNGNSHQMFDVEIDTGYINAFSTDLANTEVTAAAKASVCTYSIFGSKKIHQPGYSISEGTKPNSGPVCVCDSCGRAVRGKLKLQKIKEITEFSCAMGTPGKFGLTTNGSFKCLSNKVDLSQREAELTLLVWEGQLKRLQKESSVKVIAYELNLAQTTPSVRILAHKNGDIGYSDGVIVIANSINQFLDLCTFKLGLPKAARKLFTMNGELIIDMSQLLQPYYPELCLPLSKSSIYDAKQRRSSREEGNQDYSDTLLNSTQTLSSDLYTETDDIMSIDPNREKTATGESIKPQKRVSFANVDADKESEESPRIDKIDVRVPIDVWVSCGESFIPFEDSERLAIRTAQDREQRARVADYLEKEKHHLRQLQGRRYAGRTSNQGDQNVVKPVLMKVWEQPSKQEEILEKSIEELQLHLSELRCQQEQGRLIEVHNTRPKSAKLFDRMQERKLYDLPRGQSILVYPNGENSSRALPVIASSITELLDKSTSKLGLNSVARRAFTKYGDEIYNFHEIERNQLVCVTCGEKFVPNRERRQKIEMRASWSRSHRQKSHATPSSRQPSAALALPEPPSPIISRNSPVIRKPKHEETLHVFENSNRTPNTSPLYVPPSSSSSPRPKSAFSSPNKAVAVHGLFAEQDLLSPRTAGPTSGGSRPASSGASKLLKNSDTSLSEASTDVASNSPSSAITTYARGMPARPSSEQAKILASKTLKVTAVES